MNELPLITVSLFLCFPHLQLFNRSHTSGAYGKFNTNYLPYMDSQGLTCLHADPFTFPLNANLSIAGLINHQKAQTTLWTSCWMIRIRSPAQLACVWGRRSSTVLIRPPSLILLSLSASDPKERPPNAVKHRPTKHPFHILKCGAQIRPRPLCAVVFGNPSIISSWKFDFINSVQQNNIIIFVLFPLCCALPLPGDPTTTSSVAAAAPLLGE